MSDVNIKIKDMIVEQLGVKPDEVALQKTFVDDLKADSLDIVELIMAMEEAFNIEIPDKEAEQLKTVGDVQDYLNKKKLLT